MRANRARGKTTFIKTIAAAIRPPLSVIGGSIRYSFLDRDIYQLDRASAVGDPLAASLLHPARLDERAQSRSGACANPSTISPSRIWACRGAEFFDAVAAHLKRLQLAPVVLDCLSRTNFPAACASASTIALATVCRPEFIIADEPTTALDVVVQKSVLALIREAQREIGSSMIFVTHDMAVHANISDRLGIMYAGRLVEEAPTREHVRTIRSILTRSISSPACRGSATLTPKKALSGAPPSLGEPAIGVPLPSALSARHGHLPRVAIPR